MKNILAGFFVLILGLSFCTGIASCAPDNSGKTADILLYNGSVYTVAPGTGWESQPQEALAIQGERILYVGNSTTAKTYAGSGTRLIDLQGKMVLPGLFDTHVHYGAAAIMFSGVDLRSCKTIADYQQAIRNYAGDHPGLKVIRGFGWTHDIFNASGPDKSLIDAVVSDKPVFLTSYDGHSAWVNSKALEGAGITKATPDPGAGKIERDAQGNPSGTLRELPAMNLVSTTLPAISEDEILGAVKKNVGQASSYGVTTAHDAAIFPSTAEAYETLEKNGELPVRIYGEIIVDPAHYQQQIPDNLEKQVDNESNYQGTDELFGFDDDDYYIDANASAQNQLIQQNSPVDRNAAPGLFNLKSAKLLVDGVVEAHTAVLLAPYNDIPGFSGTPLWNQQDLNNEVANLDGRGYRIDIHAIGDGGVRMALNAYDYARRTNGVRDSRFKISHAPLISADDIPRFREMGVIAALQPNWFYADPKVYNFMESIVGSDRAQHMYTLKSLQDAGITVSFGSDWPVGTNDVTMNPLDGIQTAVTRLPFTYPRNTDVVFRPDQRISLKSAIEDATINSAYASFMENTTGSLEPGKYADLVVLDRNLFAIPSGDINTAKVVSTFLEGKEVYHNTSYDAVATPTAALPKSTPAPLSAISVLLAICVTGALVVLAGKSR